MEDGPTEVPAESLDGALVRAAKAGYADDVKELLGMGVDVNQRDHNGNTALHTACGAGHFGVVALLLQNKNIDVNAVNKLGETALHRAAHRGGARVVKLLISRNADTHIRNSQGQLPSDLAHDPEVRGYLVPKADDAALEALMAEQEAMEEQEADDQEEEEEEE